MSNDYNAQEVLHMKANLGQIICGLVVLKNGGSFVTKQYTYFHPTTIAYIAVLYCMKNYTRNKEMVYVLYALSAILSTIYCLYSSFIFLMLHAIMIN